jgi:hypothetical protein
METITIQPEKELRSLWLVIWAIWFVIELITLAILMVANPLVFGLIMFVGLIAMLLVLFWIPAFYNSLRYTIESDCVRSDSGVFWKKHVTVPFNKITNIDITEGPLQRMFGIGTIHVQTAGAGGQQGTKAELRLLGIRSLEQLKDTIMEGPRSHNIAQPVQLKSETIQQSDPQVLGQMLKELSAIRKLLENSRS